MSDLDSRSKRASSVRLANPWRTALVLPDGTIDQGDRQHIAWSYSGILALSAVRSLGPEIRAALDGADLRASSMLEDIRIEAAGVDAPQITGTVEI